MKKLLLLFFTLLTLFSFNVRKEVKAEEVIELNGSKALVMEVTTGNIAKSKEVFVNNLVSNGAVLIENHGNWSLLDVNGLPRSNGGNYSGYSITTHTGDALILIRSSDVELLKRVVDTYKPA